MAPAPRPDSGRRGLIYLAASVLDTWVEELRRRGGRETGGILVGYHTVSQELVLVAATLPGPKARHGWLTYVPDQSWDEDQAAEMYCSSGRVVGYVGEWHSHPLGLLRPSPTDRKTLRLINIDSAAVPGRVTAIVSRSRRMELTWAAYTLRNDGGFTKAPVRVIPDAHLELRPER